MNMHVKPACNLETADDLPLGAVVSIAGVVIGRSEFQNGPPSYLVQYDVRGKTTREWIQLADLGK